MGAPIDPDVGAPQADIFRYYKQALFRKYTEDWAFDEALAEVKAREKKLKRKLTSDEEADIFEKVEKRYLGRIPYKLLYELRVLRLLHGQFGTSGSHSEDYCQWYGYHA
jgi:hypothetical protein